MKERFMSQEKWLTFLLKRCETPELTITLSVIFIGIENIKVST